MTINTSGIGTACGNGGFLSSRFRLSSSQAGKSCQCLDLHRVILDQIRGQSVIPEESHAYERVSLGFVYFNGAVLAVPQQCSDIRIEHMQASIGQQCMSTTLP